MRKPLMLMRKKGLQGPFFGKYANLRSNVAKSVGAFYDVNGAGGCTGIKMTVGAQDVRYGYVYGQFGAIDPETTKGGIPIRSIWVNVAGDLVLSFGDDGNAKPVEQDTLIINFEGFGGVLVAWNETTTQYEATSPALYTYLSGQEGEELCVYSDPDFSNYYFWAADYTTDNYLLRTMLIGTEPHSTTHAAPMYAPDFEGVMQLYNANDPVWQGARVVLSGGAGTNVIEAYADDETGAPLDPQPMLVSQDEFTNSLPYSNMQTWTGIGAAAQITKNVAVAIDGTVTAHKLETIATGDYAFFRNTTTPTQIGDVFTCIYYAKQGVGDYCAFRALSGNGEVYHTFNFATKTFSFIPVGENISVAQAYTELPSGWFKLLVTIQINVAGNYFIGYSQCDDGNGAPSQPSLTVGQYYYICQTEMHANKTIEEVQGIGPIFTEASPVTTQVVNTYDSENHSNVDGPIGLIFDHPAEADMDILSLTQGAYLKVESDGGSGKQLTLTDQTNSVSLPMPTAPATVEAYALYDATALKMQLKLGSTYSAEVDYTGSFGTGDLVVGATQRSIARWNEKTIEAQQAKTLRVAQLPTL